eukprot:2509110-Rhodomonas_salina.5
MACTIAYAPRPVSKHLVSTLCTASTAWSCLGLLSCYAHRAILLRTHLAIYCAHPQLLHCAHTYTHIAICYAHTQLSYYAHTAICYAHRRTDLHTVDRAHAYKVGGECAQPA